MGKPQTIYTWVRMGLKFQNGLDLGWAIHHFHIIHSQFSSVNLCLTHLNLLTLFFSKLKRLREDRGWGLGIQTNVTFDSLSSPTNLIANIHNYRKTKKCMQFNPNFQFTRIMWIGIRIRFFFVNWYIGYKWINWVVPTVSKGGGFSFICISECDSILNFPIPILVDRS